MMTRRLFRSQTKRETSSILSVFCHSGGESEISPEMQLKIIHYVNCTVQFLNNDKYIEYVPETEYDTGHLKDTETIFDIPGILDYCADTERCCIS